MLSRLVWSSVRVGNLDDPEFAYYEYAEWSDGTPLSEGELDLLQEEFGDRLQEILEEAGRGDK